jgi:FecR-like protein
MAFALHAIDGRPPRPGRRIDVVNHPPTLRVEVEALSPGRWARVEHDLFANLDDPSASDPHGGRPRPGARDVLAGPQARAQRESGPLARWAAASAGIAAVVLAVGLPWGAVRSGDRLRLATTNSASQFTLGDSSMSVAPKSVVTVRGDDEHGIEVVLERGTVTCEVASRRGRPPFRLDAGDVRVRVTGTKFQVTHQGSGTSVDVERGTVEVTARGVLTILHDGSHWPRPLVAPPMATPSEAPAPLLPFGPMETVPSAASSPARGHRTEAIQLLNAYLARSPHGINADDARESPKRMQ